MARRAFHRRVCRWRTGVVAVRYERTLRELKLTRAERRLERLARHRLEEALPVELELLALELALRRENLALCIEAPVERFGRVGSRLLPQRALALDLLDIELLLLHALLQVELVEPALVRRAEIVAPRPRALLKLEVECVVLLLHVQPPRVGRGTWQGRCREEKAGGEARGEGGEAWHPV